MKFAIFLVIICYFLLVSPLNVININKVVTSEGLLEFMIHRHSNNIENIENVSQTLSELISVWK